MATAEFDAGRVQACGKAKIAELRAELAVKHEENIRDMMEVPYGGFWPFTKPRLRSREECERRYGLSVGHRYSGRWLAERPYKSRINQIEAIVGLASVSLEAGLVRLNQDEAAMIGISGGAS